jgi:hypothetical protein
MTSLQIFRWKFVGNHLRERLMDRDKNCFEHLFSVKRSPAAIDELDLASSGLSKMPQPR